MPYEIIFRLVFLLIQCFVVVFCVSYVGKMNAKLNAVLDAVNRLERLNGVKFSGTHYSCPVCGHQVQQNNETGQYGCNVCDWRSMSPPKK